MRRKHDAGTTERGKAIAAQRAAHPAPRAQPSQPRKRPRSQSSQPIPEAAPEASSKYSDQDWSKARRKRLESLPFYCHEYLDWRLLQSYGIEDQIRELLSVGPWAQLFEIKEPAYREVTLEFLSTVQLDHDSMTFQAYGRRHVLETEYFGHYLGLYPGSVIKTAEFRSLPETFPGDMTAQLFWEQLVAPGAHYNPSKSKATSMTNVDLRVVHHLLAHTIGGKKSSHGVVNTFAIFHLYSMLTKTPIDVGKEVAKFIYRQATDPRSKGIYCGGYITKFLKGRRAFRDPGTSDPGVFPTKISDGPFRGWGLMKTIDRRYSTQPPAPTPRAPSPSRASSSRGPPGDSDLQLVLRRLDKMEKRNARERQKNQKFRASVWAFLGRLASCFTPPPTDLPLYVSSPDPASSDTDSPPPVHREGKEPAAADPPLSSEEDLDEDIEGAAATDEGEESPGDDITSDAAEDEESAEDDSSDAAA